MRTIQIIGGAYTLYGIAGLALIGVDPTFMMFLVPGLMLLAAAWSPTT
ncbi:MAG: hypothetical protein M3Z54_06430 [Gemmatimonadota bacterium]|nr:hypothetical protein [Gemmatimonadota bacterium]